MLAGRYIWLVGASAGIGAALAKALAAEGANLALSARDKEALNVLRDELPGDKHVVLPMDVTDARSVNSAFQTLDVKWPQLDEVVYLAGTYTPAKITEYDTERAVRTMDVNVNGLLRVLGHMVPHFVKKRAGTITLFGSVAGYRGLPNAPDYCASKAAINVLAESLSIDLAAHGVKVRLVCPGFVQTRLTDKNEFDMPFRISPEQAAEYTVRGMKRGQFEIHYPKRFTLLMKVLTYLPHGAYQWLARRL